MKTTFALLLTALALATAPSAFAQDAEPSPSGLGLRATDPTVEVVPNASSSERNSSTYPMPGTPLTKASPTPTPRPSPSATPAKASSPVKTAAAEKEASPAKAPSPAKAASPTKAPSPVKATSPAPASTPISKRDVAAAIKEMEARWAAAIASHDASVPQDLVAADYVGVSSTGKVVNKATLIADMKADKNTYDSATNSGTTVRVHGNTAVIVGTTKQVGKDPTGKAFSYTYRWTDTWLERNGKWQCVASQSIAVTR